MITITKTIMTPKRHKTTIMIITTQNRMCCGTSNNLKIKYQVLNPTQLYVQKLAF